MFLEFKRYSFHLNACVKTAALKQYDENIVCSKHTTGVLSWCIYKLFINLKVVVFYPINQTNEFLKWKRRFDYKIICWCLFYHGLNSLKVKQKILVATINKQWKVCFINDFSSFITQNTWWMLVMTYYVCCNTSIMNIMKCTIIRILLFTQALLTPSPRPISPINF